MSNLKTDAIRAGGNVSAERLLLEIAYRFSDSGEFTLTPKRAGQIIAAVLVELDEAREFLARNAPPAPAISGKVAE